MSHELEFYIDGDWVRPSEGTTFDIFNPATEDAFAKVASASRSDVDRAVMAASAAFRSFRNTTIAERIELLEAIAAALKPRLPEIGELIMLEMGAPRWLAVDMQSRMALDHFTSLIDVLRTVSFTTRESGAEIVREPIGVCGIITPWNAPVAQVVGKVLPALAAGNTVVVKPSEMSPLSPLLLAEAMHEAGVPKGVFNLVNGEGAVGAMIAGHPDIPMISFTGSTATGIKVGRLAAETVKRVHQELGGKGANILLADADFGSAVATGVTHCFLNSGQVCVAPTRMLVPEDRLEEVVALARAQAEKMTVGDPGAAGSQLGPLANRMQFEKVQHLIQTGIDEGATLVTGGTGRPAGLNRGYYVKPTVFANVTPDMTIAQQEIFGPVLSIMTYMDVEDAIRIANDTPYGLTSYVSSADAGEARKVASRLEAGNVVVNYSPRHTGVPVGGYKQSGNGRQNGLHGLMEYMEMKAIVGVG